MGAIPCVPPCVLRVGPPFLFLPYHISSSSPPFTVAATCGLMPDMAHFLEEGRRRRRRWSCLRGQSATRAEAEVGRRRSRSVGGGREKEEMEEEKIKEKKWDIF
ncbi:hypothetical protein Cni_G27420 [Canna indica]|uniref:Uncharacterized protein n=1 Tax=Canna indica TaxID=4628 RepID=A0AAQ3L4W6_9LILI|nr:hypothetical protein Cni_G27420 [Canna indica]